MKRKIIALLLCIVCVFSLCFPAAADDDGFSAIIGDIDKTCPTCGSALHAFWWSTSGAEVEVEISDTGKIKIPAGAGADILVAGSAVFGADNPSAAIRAMQQAAEKAVR